MNRFWSSVVHQLTPYTPGEQPNIEGLVKLNTNENPYPPSPEVAKAIAAVSKESYRLYPDPQSGGLCQAIGRFWGVAGENVFVGNGSDEVLAFVFQGLLKHDKPVVFPDITYSFYPSYCRLYDVPFSLLALDDDFSIDLQKIASTSKTVIFPNPNAPTGRGLAMAAIESFARGRPDTLVVVDEAYVDFGAQSCVPLTQELDNVLVTQSLSKSRALAGLRIGYAIGSIGLIEALNRIKNSFNSYPMDRLAGPAGIAAMNDRAWFESNRDRVIASRGALSGGLRELGFEVIPSQANFVFARHPRHEGAVLFETLRRHNILVRHFAKPRIDQFLRITVGTDEQIEALLGVLSRFLKP